MEVLVVLLGDWDSMASIGLVWQVLQWAERPLQTRGGGERYKPPQSWKGGNHRENARDARAGLWLYVMTAGGQHGDLWQQDWDRSSRER